MSKNGNPLRPCTWIILRTIRNRSNMSIAKMFASGEEQSINRVFHSSKHGSRVIVADITKRCRGMETRWDLVLELSWEPLEIDQICQLQRCSPRWEEQSINRVFHSGIHGSRDIVADAKKNKNVRLVKRNSLLIECFTFTCLELELLLLI